MGNSKMNARERIDYLFDDHSFVEVGGYVSARNTDYNLGAKKVEGDGVITGYGVINDRMVYGDENRCANHWNAGLCRT